MKGIKYSLAVLPLLFMSSTAAADPVDQPGSYGWYAGGGQMEFNLASPISLTIPAAGSPPAATNLDTDLDSAGNITFTAFTIGSVTTGNWTITLQVLVGGSSGTVDASVGGYNTSMSLQLRLKFVNPVLGITAANCQSSTFTRPFEAGYVHVPANPPTPDYGVWEIYSNTGGSVGGGTGWLTVPAFTGTACNNQVSTVNSTFGLGVTGQGLNIVRLTAHTFPGFTGS